MLETLLILFSLSIDAFVTSFAYGSNKTKLSFSKKSIITSISSFILIISMFLGYILQRLFPRQNTLIICTIMLGALGAFQLIQFLLKNYLNKQPNGIHYSHFKLLGICFKLEASVPQALTKEDNSKGVSLKEAIFLGLALSLDSIGIGISIGLIALHFIPIFILSILINFFMLSTGNLLGYKLSQKLEMDLGWLSGIILIFLAALKLS